MRSTRATASGLDGTYVAVSVGMTDRYVDPDDLTLATGLEPSRAWKRGDQHTPRSGRQFARSSGLWAVEREGQDVQSVAIDLLSAAEPHADAIRDYARSKKSVVSVGIWWEPEDGRGGLSVSAQVVRRLADLCDRVDFYYPG